MLKSSNFKSPCCKEGVNTMSGCRCGEPVQNYSCGEFESFFCPRLRNYVLRGPRGFTGPRGPQGLPGVNPISSFVTLVSPANQLVEGGGNVEFADNVNLHGSAIMHNLQSDIITLNAGAYLVIWKLDSSVSEDGDIEFGLVVNGVEQNNSIASVSLVIDEIKSLGSNYIISVDNNSSLQLQNNSNISVNVQNVSMSILKIA